MTPETKKILTFSVIALVILLSAIYFSYFYKSSPSKVKNATPSELLRTPEEIKTSMLSHAKLQFAEISSEESITSLPKDLSFLQLSGATNVKTENTKYKNSKTGYKLAFDSASSLDLVYRDYYIIFGKQSGWTVSYGAISDTFGVIDMSGAKYNARVSIDSAGQSAVKVNIEVNIK